MEHGLARASSTRLRPTACRSDFGWTKDAGCHETIVPINCNDILRVTGVERKVTMSFSVRVVRSDGDPAEDVGVMIDYGILGGCDEKRTDSDGWVEFHNPDEKSGTIWVHGEKMGDHSLADGKTYSFTL